MTSARAIHIKARAVLRDLGHSESDPYREYKDWHIEIRSGLAFITIWSSGRMVFLSLSNVPVHYQTGPWEHYLDRLFHRIEGTSERGMLPRPLPVILDTADECDADDEC